MTDIVRLYLGETRKITLSIENQNGSIFEIRNARWEFQNQDIVEAMGDCNVVRVQNNEMHISALISPLVKGLMTLRFFYQIEEETFEQRVMIRVI